MSVHGCISNPCTICHPPKEQKAYEWKHQQIGFEIKLQDTPENRKFLELIDASKLCAEHGMYYAITFQKYRKYKRGKNRCQRCGVKLPSELPEIPT